MPSSAALAAATTVMATAFDRDVNHAAGLAGTNVATTVCLPIASLAVVTLARPPETGIKPSDLEPSAKETLPAAPAVTTAMNDTGWPAATLPTGTEVSLVVVAWALTVSVTAAEVEAVNTEASAGRYIAVTEWWPPASIELVRLAVPAAVRVAVPSLVLPSRKLTVPPVGAGSPAVTGETVAAKVTGVPCATVPVGVTVRLVAVLVAGALTTRLTAPAVESLKLVWSDEVNIAE